ncbi:MAG: cytochrome b [Gammaproteobacteria bacterium]|nr:cytochrome b [Gammaproteobacteria bacterium]
MMLRNSATAYGVIAKLLHWVTAVLIFALVWLGWYMVDLTYFDRWYNASLRWHKSLGMLVLALAVIKLGWLLASPEPALSPSLARWQRAAAKATHHALVTMLVLVPVTGYLISTSAGKGVSVFGWLEIPAVVPASRQLRDLAIAAHYYLAYGTAIVAGVHALAALKHQFVDRDGTLTRMLWR